MKKIFLSAAVILMMGTFATAQNTDGKRPSRDGKPKTEMKKDFGKDLNLTDAQKKQMQDLRTESMEKRKAISENTALSDEQKNDAYKKLRESMRTKSDAILTPAQRAKMQENRKNMSDKRPDGAGKFNNENGRRTGGNWTNLSDTQKEQIRKLNETYSAKEKEISDNTFLSKDAKQNQLQELRKQKKAAMDQVLTPEQKQQMKGGKRDSQKSNKERTRSNNRPNLRS